MCGYLRMTNSQYYTTTYYVAKWDIAYTDGESLLEMGKVILMF